MNILQTIYEFFKKLWKWFKSLFEKKKENPIVRISVLSVVLFLLLVSSPVFSQRPNLQYVYASFHQDSIERVGDYTVQWITDSLTVSLTDTANAKVWFNNSWTPYQSGMITDSVRIQVNKPIDYDTEYIFRVVAKNANGDTVSDPVPTYFIVSDIDDSKSVDGIDLIRLSLKWGYTGLGYRDWEDINGDGNADGLDLIIMSKDWGRTWMP